jgi:hypothetical protein
MMAWWELLLVASVSWGKMMKRQVVGLTCSKLVEEDLLRELAPAPVSVQQSWRMLAEGFPFDH